ncbi:dihydropyrimidinase [Microbacterium excoecariae]|uniref:dihydropyrimidinase n=1 Tax=Microbacterium excoecariae TaxID=2715210 RepID=UPI00140BE40F|nr:dihydropyrimidinase [Microbacterium excoecariae]NHI17704.1 dihydropyrimidinase [Microbacterium excoecariae]
MNVDLVIRGGTLVEADWMGPSDLFVSEGRVAAIVAPGTPAPDGAQIVDATGRLVMPGGVDPHCHVGFTSGEFTSRDDYAECTTAAVFGGTTTIVDFAIPRPGEVPIEVARAQRAKADQGWCDSALHASVVAWDDTVPDQLRTLASEGVVTVKMFTTYRGESMAEPDTILKTMQVLQEVGGMVVIHCEANAIIEEDQRRAAGRGEIDAGHMHDSRSALAETAAVAEVLAIAESIGAPVYFVHQSTPAAVDLVADARRRGVRAFTESVAHHLVLDDAHYLGAHPERFVCCPPLRDRETVDALGEYLFNGEITTIGSDHCCYDTAQKETYPHDVRIMPNGLPGVETRLPVIFSEFVSKRGLSPRRFVEATAANPAKVNGLYPRKGTLRPGSDADIVLWDPAATWTIRTGDLHMATDYTPYEGMEVTGRPADVFVRGERVVAEGAFVGVRPTGRHVPAGAVDTTVV